jgi:hypothetical protein
MSVTGSPAGRIEAERQRAQLLELLPCQHGGGRLVPRRHVALESRCRRAGATPSATIERSIIAMTTSTRVKPLVVSRF